MARITENSSAITAIESVGISMTKMSGETKNAGELIEEVAGKWDTLTDAERRNLSIGIGGIYQLTRTNALFNNYAMSQDAATTAAESFGSAMKEQDVYNASLEARLNRLNTAWYDLANTLGETIIYDAVVFGTSALEAMTNAGGTAGSSIVTLATTLGVLGGALSLLSTRYKMMTADVLTTIATQKLQTASTTSLTGRMWMLVGGINAETASQIANTAATNANTGAKVGATMATTALTAALRGLLAATGVGLLITGIGVAAGFLINKFSEAKQATEEFESYMAKNTTSLSENKEEVDKLLTSLEGLRRIENLSTEQKQELVNVQNRLAELYPALIDKVDANGNAHIKSADAIEKEIAITNELINAERELQRTQAKDTFKEKGKDLDSLSQKIENTRNKLEYLMKHESGDNEAIAQMKLDLLNLERQYSDSSKEIQKTIVDVANSWLDAGESISGVVMDDIQKSLDSLDFSKLSAKELASFSKELSSVMKELDKAFASGDSEGFNKATEKVEALYDSYGLLEDKNAVMVSSFNEIQSSADKTGDAFAEAGQEVDEYGNVIDRVAEAQKEFKEGMDKLVDSISNINGILEDYNETGQISTETILDLVTEYPQLLNYINDEARLIQELTKIRDEDVSAAQQQLAQKIDDSEEFYNANLKMIESYFAEHFKFYKGDLTQFKTLAQAKADVEVQLINSLAKKWGEYYNTATHWYNSSTGEFQVDNWAVGSAAGNSGSQAAAAANKELVAAKKAFDNISLSQVNLDFSKIGTSLDKVSSSASKAGSSVDKATSQSIYVTDEYKLAMDELNSALAQQNALKDDYSSHSENYRKALQGEVDLLEKQLKLQKDQAASLRSQIASGKIRQTGTVTVPTTSSTTTTSSGTVKVSGWSGALTSKQGMRWHPIYQKYMSHDGIDLAGAKGTRLDAHVSGKVIGQGYNSRSGNYVQIQDASGNKHFFAHLDKAIAKLGDTIVAGQQIGTIGNTGASKGAHLHYEVKDKNGKYLDAATYAKQARTGSVTGTVTSTVQQVGSTVVDNGQQAVDDALSTLYGLEADIVSTQESIDSILEEIRQSFLESFTYRKGVMDDMYNREAASMRNADKWSKKYNDSLWNQMQFLDEKKKIQEEEKAYLEQQINSGELNERQVDELVARYGELVVSMKDLDSEIWQHQIEALHEFVAQADIATNTIDYMKKMMETLSQGTSRYAKVLDEVSEQLRIKKKANEDELKGLMDIVAQNEISGEAMAEAVARIHELRIGIQDLANEIQNNNFEIIMNIKIASDEAIDDLDYELQKSQIFQDSYTEGSALWQKEVEKQLELQKQIMDYHNETRVKLQGELLSKELTAERIKEIYEAIEDESLAYLNASKAIDELNKQMEDAKKSKLEEIANDAIDAIKDYWNERKDEHMKGIEEEIEAENEAHEKRKKMLQDEMDLFRKNVQERLDIIDKAENERSYRMEMDEMEVDRKKIVDQINLLSVDDSHEAKKQRKQLQEDLAELDKQIAERQHDWDIEQRKEALNEQLEDKEEHMEILNEQEDERHNAEIERIEREREYWEKYYTDRINDEREYARIRKAIIDGNFEEIQNLMGGYADQLESTMYKLEDTLDGTMQSVGTSIRQNVIDRLREALSLVSKFNESQTINPDTGLDGSNDTLMTDDFDPNAGKGSAIDQSVSNNNDKEKLSQADLKVLTAKYMNEQLYYDTPEPQDQWWVKYKADTLAATGRQEGSTIPATIALKDLLPSMSKEDLQRLSSYAKSLSTTYLNNPDHQRHMQDWASRVASLDSGGYLNFGSSSGGIDGKGGRAIIAHDGEVVLNKVQTNRLLDNIEVSDGILSKLSNIASAFSSMFDMNTPSAVGMGDTYITFGDVNNASQQQAQNFATEIVNQINIRKGGL